MRYFLTLISMFIFLILVLNTTAGVIADVQFDEIPTHLQLYTRNENDSAKVTITGVVMTPGYDSIEVTVYKNESSWKIMAQELIYAENAASFGLEPTIHAELSEYKFDVTLISGDYRDHIITVDSVLCGDAYILSGQSNSHYVWEDADYSSEFCRTFGVKTGMSNYNPYQPEDTLWNLAQGQSYLGPNVGALGLYIQKLLLEQHQIPTALINGGTGGSVISEHLPDASDRLDLNSIYGKLLYRITKSKIGHTKGIIWHQGENDADLQNTPLYADRFQELYDAWKLDFSPEKIYVFQIRPGCGGNIQGRFREVQRTLPELLQVTDITLMSTTGIPGHDDGCHYSLSGYQTMAQWIFNVIAADFYGSTDTLEIFPANIIAVNFIREQQELHLKFEDSGSLIWPDEMSGLRMEDYFYLDGYFGMIDSGYASGDSVVLKLKGQQYIDKITYLPDVKDNTGLVTYEGPWVTNSRGIGALSFYEFPVTNPPNKIKVVSPNGNEILNPGTQYTITWESDGVGEVDIEFSADNGQTWSVIIEDILANPAKYFWTVPDTSSEECRIRIVNNIDNSVADESNLVFSIVSKSLSIIQPNGGEALLVDSVYTVKWQSEFIDNVRIQYSVDNGNNWGTVKRTTQAAPGQVDWVVPDNLSDSCLVRIIDTADDQIFDISDEVFSIKSIAGVYSQSPQVPEKFGLKQNWPNPFNPSTTIEYNLEKTSQVTLYIMNSLGEKITTIIDENKSPGNYRVIWNGRNAVGIPVASGIYYYILSAGQEVMSKKMLLIR